MSNALLSYVNHVLGSSAIRSASSAAGDLAADNFGDPIIGKRWRTTDLTGYGQVDFGADKTVGVLALVFPRDTMGALAGTVRHYLDADGGTAGSGAAYDSTATSIGATEGYGYHLHVLPSSVSARYWRFTFAASGVSYIDVGLAWAGEAFQPSRNFSYGYSDEWQDRSIVTTAQRSGAEYVDERDRQRMIAFALDSMSAADASTIRELRRIVGISKQILFVKDPTDTTGQEIIIGRPAQTSPIMHRSFPIRSSAFIIRESL